MIYQTSIERHSPTECLSFLFKTCKFIKIMIIIETKNCPVLLNDREVRGVAFDKAKNEAIVTFANDMPQRMVAKGFGLTSKFEYRTMTIADVEHVRYMGDKCSEIYTY